jgi:hypothetical protein
MQDIVSTTNTMSKGEKRNTINIFDIDGCIMDSNHLFPKLDGSGQTPMQIEAIVTKVKQKGKRITLFPNFIKYYDKDKDALENIFITGRKRSHFHKLTTQQLWPLMREDNFLIIYYPETFTHTENNYIFYKFKTVLNYILHFTQKYLEIKPRFHIFDDNIEYFSHVLYHLNTDKYHHTKNYNIMCFQVSSNKDWSTLEHYIHYKDQRIIKNTLKKREQKECKY